MSERSGQSEDLSGSIVGRYRIRRRLGAGGMGEVYLAEDPQLKRTVAIKRMAARLGEDEQHRQRFLREAQMASRLNDPRIAAIYDVFERKGEIFLVMECVEGKTLRQRMGGPMKLEEFLPLAIQCAEGVAAAQAQGVLHRDIKPENIMVTPSGQVKILDFGLARRLTPAEETAAFETEPGALSGTSGYIAPEVLIGGDAEAPADVFSLGVVFYEAVTGRHPFRARTHIATSNRVLHENPPPPSSSNASVPAELDRVVGRMLAKNPQERYPTAKGAAEELTWIARSGSAPTAPVLPAIESPAPRRGWRRVALGAMAAVAVVALLAAIGPVRRTVERWFAAGAGAPGERQLAVLPFTARGGTAAQQAFAAGLTDAVTARLTELSATHSLAVVPESEIFARKVDSPDMARRQFGVNLVLTGSLQQAGGQIRVTYALVDARTQRQLNARTKTFREGDPFAVEDDVSTGVLDMLQLQLKPAERKTFEAKGTDKPGAYAFYLQGMGYLNNYERPEDVANAISVFEHALAIDPQYAGAYAGLGQAIWQRYQQTQDAQWIATSEQACGRALAIDPNLAEGHICLGAVANGTGKYQEAAAQFQKALAVEPTNDGAYRGLAAAYEKLGRTAEAEQTYQEAMQLRPQYWAGYTWLGIFYFRQGRYPDAERMFQQVVALAPDSFRGYYDLGAVYAQMGDFAKAVPALERSIEIRPNDVAYTNLGVADFFLHRYHEAVANFQKAVELQPKNYLGWRNLGDGYFWAPGMREKAGAAYRKSIDLAEDALKVNPRDAYVYEILAICQAMSGESQPALQSLAKALELAPGDPSAAMARNDPGFDALRGRKDFPGDLNVPNSTSRRQP
jgi:eukaryotic-like serine/threonine-protein kinase